MDLNSIELLNTSKQLLRMSKSLELLLNLKNHSEEELFKDLIGNDFDENKIIFSHSHLKDRNFEDNTKI